MPCDCLDEFPTLQKYSQLLDCQGLPYAQEMIERDFESSVKVLFDFSHIFPQGLEFDCTSILIKDDLF